MGWRRGLLALVCVQLGIGFVVTAGSVSVPSPPPIPHLAEAPDATTAMAAARRQHEPVLITSLGTTNRKVSAKPDGTMSAELSVEPMQVRRGDRWVPVDATLTSGPQGTVTPRATVAEMVFSGGGSAAPLLRFGAPGQSVSMSWPGALPAPILSGQTATYLEVLPGVDLTLRADATGVAQHLVVKNAAAAKGLARIPLGFTADGLTVGVNSAGGLEGRNAKGALVYGTPPATMWDASNEKRAPVGLTLAGGTLTLLPDQGFLADPDVRYPVTIDPDSRTLDHFDWAKVFSGSPTTTYWYGANDVDGWGKVGTCIGWAGCGGVDVARTYFQFDTGFLNGRRIIKANFNATIVYGPKCVTSPHELHANGNGGFGMNINWNNAPQGWTVGTSNADSNYTGCAGYKPIGWNVKDALNTAGWTVFYIKAANEGDKDAWRKYDGGATRLVIDYNTKPNAPTELTTDPKLTVCKWCGGKAYVGDDFIRLKGKLTDPDGADQLTAAWDVTGGAAEHHDGPKLTQGNTFSYTVDLRNRDGQTVGWTLKGNDGWDTGPAMSAPSFVVDRVGFGPTEKPVVTAGLYQPDGRWHGGVGVPGTFTFDGKVADVDHYLYGWNQDPSDQDPSTHNPTTQVDADALGGKATVSVTPPGDGPRDLFVQSVDRAGHRSPPTQLHLYIRAGNGPLAQYSLDGNASDSAFLGDRNGTVNGGASYAAGAVGTALVLDGTSGYVSAPNAIRTDASFSVSAWVRLDRSNGARAILSQDGASFAGFNLWYRDDNGGRWVFAMVDPNAVSLTDAAWSAAPAQVGSWTQLTAVYDAPANQVRLYVNGVLSASAVRSSPPVNATGQVQIGRTMWSSMPGVDYFPGAIDEVKLYDRILSDAEIRAAVSRDNVQAGYWKFDETGGTTVANTVPSGSMGVLQGGARFVPDGAVGGAVQLDSPNDFVQTTSPVVRTDQSFSVAAWARIDQAPAGTGFATVVSQDGAVNSGFLLGYRSNPNGAWWELYTVGADAVPHPGDSAVASGPIAKLGDWTHLAAVYDAPAAKIRIYVNGVLAGTATHNGGFNATGPMLVGRSKWEGVYGNPWHGAIDDVRAYSRVISEDEVRGLVSGGKVTLADWALNGDTLDSSPHHQNATPVNSVAYTAGQTSMPDSSDLAIRLDGSQSWVSAPHVVDADRSFSVAAWAKVDQLGPLSTVVSEDGNQISAFKLRARDDGRWSFVMFNSDGTTSPRDEVLAGAVQLGQWAHLVAVYDAGAHQIQLYVNGVLAGSVAHTQAWNPSGGFQIGRAKWSAGPVEYFTGAIDDVSVYSRPLFASEIQTMAGRDLSLVHDYPVDESSGRNASDAVGARAATLTGGASFSPGRVGNAVTFNGVDGAATTTGVDVRTDQAFTVSAWVQLSKKDCDLSANPGGCKLDAISQDGARTSKFRLGHVMDGGDNQLGVWSFEMPESDADNAVVTQAAVATEPSDVGAWTHLVGVYDPATKKIWLYVNGVRVGDGTLNTAWQATGGLALGRGMVNGVAREFWPGSVDDVRLYTGQLDKDRVSALYHSYPAAAGTAALPVADAAEWRFDERAGSTAADSSGNGMTATFSGGYTWVGGRNGPSGAYFDGTSGYAQTTGPVVDTGRAFSAAAWVYLTNAGTGNYAVLGQDGNRLSTFVLGYNGAVKKWMVLVPSVDADNPGNAVTILNSTEPAGAGEWTHLAMTYDPALRQLRLYVNGMLSAAQVGVSVLPAAGPMSIGRSKWNGLGSAFFPRAVDEVRVYNKVLSDGEVRRVHDDVVDADLGYYRFDDGTGKDSTWRHYDATVSGNASFGPGVNGQALALDGTSGAATGPSGLPMHDSFTVSGWAKLGRTDQIATVVSQDGDRMSGYALQYRPELNRWVFGAAATDTDGAPLVYAMAVQPPRPGEWTHLTGVYDYPARQLRLYVDGQLAGVKNNAVLWRATGKLVIGRGKINGVPAGFFPGSLDEVRAGEGVATEANIAIRGGWGTPWAGQLGRFVNTAGDHYTGRTDTVRPGYHFEGTLGRLAASGPNTRTLYACQAGADAFTSTDPTCEGQAKVADIGLVYTIQPTNLPTIPIYRCAAGGDRFESRLADCEGATQQSVLGYTVAYGTLVRYGLAGWDHVSTVDGSPASYVTEFATGLVDLSTPDGTQQRLMNCRDGADLFASTDPLCEGKTVLGVIGSIWPTAPALPSRPIYRCRIGTTDSFVSVDPGCEGTTFDRQLGYVRSDAPDVPAVFAS